MCVCHGPKFGKQRRTAHLYLDECGRLVCLVHLGVELSGFAVAGGRLEAILDAAGDAVLVLLEEALR